MTMAAKPHIHAWFDAPSNTVTYLVADPETKRAAVIDPVFDYDHKSGKADVTSVEAVLTKAGKEGYAIDWVLETHVHADHLSGAPYIQKALGGKIGIGRGITVVQDTFGKVFNEGTEFQRDGSQFDRLFSDGDSYQVGGMTCVAMHTPGHTPACMTHVMGDAAFVGDTLFMPDGGSARADFPGGDAGQLWDSIQKVLALPDEMRLFMCHDYGPNGREIRWETSVAEEKAHNIHIAGKSRDEFVSLRTARDATLAMPKLIIPSLQVNMRGGDLPPADEDGKRFLKVPINGL